MGGPKLQISNHTRAEATTKKEMKFMEETASSGVLDPSRLAQEAPSLVRSASRAMEALATEIQSCDGSHRPRRCGWKRTTADLEALRAYMLELCGISAGAEPQRAGDKALALQARDTVYLIENLQDMIEYRRLQSTLTRRSTTRLVPNQIPAIPQDLDASTASSSISTPQTESETSSSSRASDDEDVGVGVGVEASGAELAPTFIDAPGVLDAAWLGEEAPNLVRSASRAMEGLAAEIQSCDGSHRPRSRGWKLRGPELDVLETHMLEIWGISAGAEPQRAGDKALALQSMRGVKVVNQETLKIGHLPEKGAGPLPNPPQPQVPDSGREFLQSVVIGRDKEIDDILQMLIQPCRKPPPEKIISLVGLGGIGKTTLAQMVFNDARVQQHFDVKCWVTVSTSSNKMELTTEILRSAQPAWDGSTEKMLDFQTILSELCRFVASKLCLIVLDDVCNITDDSLLDILTALQSADIGSRILVTSRINTVPHMLGASPPYTVNPLRSDDCWALLKEQALPSDCQSEYPDLQPIGEQIAAKLNGSPLGVKLVGGLLGDTRSKDQWIKIMETGLQDNTLFSALQLSYKYLPIHLKRCFAYCSLFPQDYKFDPAHLSRLWIAEGFVQLQGKPEKKMEDIAREYFDQLLSRSFFQEIKVGAKTYYLVHNLLHDLAKSVASEDCFRLDDGMNCDIPSTVCHLSVTMNSLPSLTSFSGLEKLRTLLTRPSLLSSCSFQEDFAVNLKCILEKSKHLRVLDLSGCILEELPQCIDGLLHLRYLSIHGSIQRLPESIGKLLHLQTLCFTGKCYLEKLPASISMLVNLRHLLVETKSNARLGIGRLGNIQGSLELHLEKREVCKLEEDCFQMDDDMNCDIPSSSSSSIQLLQDMIEYGRLPSELLSNQSTAELLPALNWCLPLFASSEPLPPLAQLLDGVPDQIPTIPQDLDTSTASSSITTPQAKSEGSGSSRASDEEDVGVGDEASGAELAPTFINATVDRSPDVDGILNKILDAFRGIHLDIRSSDESTIHPANRDLIQSMEIFCGNTDRVQLIFDCWVSKLEEVAEWICQGDQGRRYIFLLNNTYDAWQMCPGASFSNVEELTSRFISMIHRYKKSYFDECWVPLTNPCRLDKFTLAFNTICKRQMTWKVTAELRYTLRQEIADLILPPYILALEANQSALSEIFYSLKRVMAGKKKQERLTVEALEKVIKELFEGWTPR